jgi:hypothetical protein
MNGGPSPWTKRTAPSWELRGVRWPELMRTCKSRCMHCIAVDPSKFAAAGAGHAMCYAEEAASEGHTETWKEEHARLSGCTDDGTTPRPATQKATATTTTPAAHVGCEAPPRGVATVHVACLVLLIQDISRPCLGLAWLREQWAAAWQVNLEDDMEERQHCDLKIEEILLQVERGSRPAATSGRWILLRFSNRERYSACRRSRWLNGSEAIFSLINQESFFFLRVCVVGFHGISHWAGLGWAGIAAWHWMLKTKQ